MSLRYAKIKKKPTVFQRLFGISPQQFEIIFQKSSLYGKKSLSKNIKDQEGTLSFP